MLKTVVPVVAVVALVAFVWLAVPSRLSGARKVPRFGLFEITFTSEETFDNPFWEPAVSAEFTSPDGRKIKVEGFCFGGTEWKVRFVPDSEGEWTYAAAMKSKANTLEQAGGFTCVASEAHGFLRVSRKNPCRLEYDDGTSFYGIGYQTGGLLSAGHDGPTEDGKWRSAPLEEFLKAFDGAANLNRLQLGCGTTDGCACMILNGKDGLDRYDTTRAAELDEAYRLYRKYNVSQILIFFQDMSLWGNPKTCFGRGRDTENYKNVNAANMPMQEKYIRYVVARYAAFIDIWELFNEDSYAPNDYLAHLAKVVRDADPYDHIITTNYERPDEDWCEIICPHEYMGMPANEVDAHLINDFARFKSFGKPVQYTEFGNEGFLSNYDPVKWRIVVWTAYTREVGMLFWSMSGRIVDPQKGRIRGNSNAYLGPETRKYFRILQSFVGGLPVDMRPVLNGFFVEAENRVRAGVLGNGEVCVLYVHHYADHETEVKPKPLMVWTGRGCFKVTWMDPATGEVVESSEQETDQPVMTLSIPAFKVDLAGKLERIRQP